MRFATLILCVMLYGCGAEPPVSSFETYQARMTRVLDVGEPEDMPVERVGFPPARTLRVEQAAHDIDLLDFLSLGDCELQQVIARRNNALGKVATASTRLVLDLDFLRLAPPCEARLQAEGNSTLSAALATARLAKRDTLASSIWQALLGAAEYRQFWGTPGDLSGYPAAANLPVDESLEWLVKEVDRWLAGDYGVDQPSLERALKQLAAGDGGTLVAALELQARSLQQLDVLLRQRHVDPPLCPGPGSEQAPALRHVVTRFFVGDIQPWSARLNARRMRLIPLVQRLENRLVTGETSDFREWRFRRDQQLTRWAEAPKIHVAAMLPVLEQCGVAPGT